RTDPDQPGGGRQRPLLLRRGVQGRPGAAPRHPGGRLPEVPGEQRGAPAVLLQVCRAADAAGADVRPLRQAEPPGQPLLHLLWESVAMSPRSVARDWNPDPRTADNGQRTSAMAPPPSDPVPQSGGLLARLRGMVQGRKPVEAAPAEEDVLPTWDESAAPAA